MALLILLLLILLIVTGSLLSVLKVALAVAIGLVLAIVALVMVFAWWIRRKWRAALAGTGGSARTAQASSTVEVLTPRSSPSRERPAGSIPPRVIDVSPLGEDETSRSD